MSTNTSIVCPRGHYTICKPLHLYNYEDAIGFICCGSCAAGTVPKYLMCVKRGALDTMYGYEHCDLLAMWEVLSQTVITESEVVRTGAGT